MNTEEVFNEEAGIVTPKRALVNTATLIRGRVYFFGDMQFLKDQPVVVNDELADRLEDVVLDMVDREGDSVSKPFFRVERGVAEPESPSGRLSRASRNIEAPSREPAAPRSRGRVRK